MSRFLNPTVLGEASTGSIRIGARFFQTADTRAVLAWRRRCRMLAPGCGLALSTLMGFPGSVEQIQGLSGKGLSQ